MCITYSGVLYTKILDNINLDIRQVNINKNNVCLIYEDNTGYPRSNWTKLNSYFRQKTIHGDQKHDLYIFFRSWHLCFYL